MQQSEIIHRQRLFTASCMALVVTAMSFAVRGDIMPALTRQFHLTHEQMGLIAGPAFYGFTLAMIFGGPLCDVLGMGTLLAIAFVGHAAGILITIFATGFKSLYTGTLLIGIGNGMVEAFANPLIASMYPEKKIKMLSHFHAWFPGGIVIGGLAAFALGEISIGWQWKMVVMFVPLVLYGIMFAGQKFPRTERVSRGVSTAEMFGATLRPFFIFMACCMLLTAATELGTNQWISSLLGRTAMVHGILVLCWINGLMAVGRQFAGPVVRRLSPFGLLTTSAALAFLGLLALSYSHNGWEAFGAAAVFAAGVCFFWPTMLGITSERVPRSGALGLAIMGGVGMFSVSIVLPMMGRVFDTSGPAVALRSMAVLPLILVLIFGIVYVVLKRRGGYRKEELAVEEGLGAEAPVE